MIKRTKRQHFGRQWWVILRPFVGCLWMGPYATKAEAEEEQRATARLIKRGEI